MAKQKGKRIKLTQGRSTIVSTADYAKLKKHKWCAKKSAFNWYAVRGQWSPATHTVTIIRMHRLIMKCPKAKRVHHRNGDTLDNRRRNLEIVTNHRRVQAHDVVPF